ncbi:Hypothetical predicted protein [Podarcis lilfordi]|uniref:Uncharacterized protein n=1 Tax=Podarcis lilfordi TaxID=74358 RepID=A0AA35LEY1_9SAUR|nr:Hypothetical predicted protein [Podarcis lilfordi]
MGARSAARAPIPLVPSFLYSCGRGRQGSERMLLPRMSPELSESCHWLRGERRLKPRKPPLVWEQDGGEETEREVMVFCSC